MNKLKKMLIKSDFFKAIEGYSTECGNVSLYSFESSIEKLNKKIEDDLAFCLSYVFGFKIDILPNFSDEYGLVFKDLPNVLYKLNEGKIKPVWNASNKAFMNIVNYHSSELGIINKAYLELMESYKTVEIPLTERVSFCYSFYGGHWFQLKDKKDSNKHIKIRELVSKSLEVDTDDQCYFSWDDFYELVISTKIHPNYDNYFKKISEDVALIIKELKQDLGIIKPKKEDKSHDNDYNSSVVNEEQPHDRLIIREVNLFVEVDGVKCVREEWKRFLRYLDLANISFAGVYIAGLDFTGSNAVIDPETVYNKDVSMCTFDDSNLVSDPDISTECGRLRKK